MEEYPQSQQFPPGTHLSSLLETKDEKTNFPQVSLWTWLSSQH